MAVFEDFKFKWKDKEHTVKAENLLIVIAEVQEHCGFRHISKESSNEAKQALGFCALLRFFGVIEDADSMYEKLLTGSSEVRFILYDLQRLMVPKSLIKEVVAEPISEKKPKTPKSRKKA